ncbi:hypothetical protein JCM8097_002733 [Rhodosporidiobolus ruineniae]
MPAAARDVRLRFSPSYCLVGAYRLVHDRSLLVPLWRHSQKGLKRAAILAIPFTLVSLSLTRFYVTFVLSRSPLSPANIHDAALLGISPVVYTTWALILGQLSTLFEWFLGRELKKAREEAYEATVRSRAKEPEFWGPYVEEWKVPPVERAQRAAEKQNFYTKLSTPLVRVVLLKVLLTPLSFIPFLSLTVMAAIRSLTLGRQLHRPFFEAKKMSPFQIELWVTERQTEYRAFGFVASLLERIPFLGLVFSISNRIGAAMYAHDLEKRQHLFRSGDLQPTQVYISKLAQVAADQRAAGMPEELLSGVGGFPSPGVETKLAGVGMGRGGGGADEKPPLPPR